MYHFQRGKGLPFWDLWDLPASLGYPHDKLEPPISTEDFISLVLTYYQTTYHNNLSLIATVSVTPGGEASLSLSREAPNETPRHDMFFGAGFISLVALCCSEAVQVLLPLVKEPAPKVRR